jgi:predicted nucleotidyltransferase
MKNCINIVKEIVLEKVPLQDYAVFLFGSRALGNNHEMSDIDIKLNLEQELEDCIVPFKVDIIDFNGVSDKFKKYALEKIEIWNLSKNSILNY